MKKSRLLGITYLFAALASLGMTGASQAGMIYDDETSFNTALGSLSLVWSEDFEGFSAGGVSNPLLIAGGQAEVGGFGTTSVLFSKSWIGSNGGPTSIQGPGGTSLGLSAISFNFANYQIADEEVIFNLAAGGPDVSDPFSPTAFATPVDFIGWIGGSGEVLTDVTFLLNQSVILDNINGYVPIPAAVWLFGSGLLGLVGIARRKKA